LCCKTFRILPFGSVSSAYEKKNAMITVKRLSQPPQLAWAVWDTDRPEAVIHCTLPGNVFAQAREQGSEVLREVVAGELRDAQEKLRVFTNQLDEL